MDIKNNREEIIRRSREFKEKQEKRILHIMESCCSLLVVALMFVIREVTEIGTVGMNAAEYGTLMLGPEVGSYIIVGILCFLIGILITLIAVKKRKNDNK